MSRRECSRFTHAAKKIETFPLFIKETSAETPQLDIPAVFFRLFRESEGFEHQLCTGVLQLRFPLGYPGAVNVPKYSPRL